MAMGAMLEEAQPMVTAESISHQSYRRLLSRAREYVLENMSEPVTVLDLCNQLHVSRRIATKRVSRYFRHWPKCVAETHSPERRTPRTDKPLVAKHNGKKTPPCSGDSGIWGNSPRIISNCLPRSRH